MPLPHTQADVSRIILVYKLQLQSVMLGLGLGLGHSLATQGLGLVPCGIVNHWYACVHSNTKTTRYIITQTWQVHST